MVKFKKIFSLMLLSLFLSFLMSLSSNLFAQPKKDPLKKTGRLMNPRLGKQIPKDEEMEEEDDEEDDEDISDDEDEEDDEEDDEEEEFKKPRTPLRQKAQRRNPQFPTVRPQIPMQGKAGQGVIQEGEYITLDFKGELKDLITMFSDLMNKNFISDENIRDRVTIIAPKRLSSEAAWKVFLSVLDYKGYNVIETDEIVRIQKSAEARQQPIRTLVGEEIKDIPNQAQIVTYVINLQYADVDQIRGAISQLMSPRDANISTFSPTNTLILTDIASNINRIIKIINAIDVAGLEDRPIISVVPLNNASAKALAQELTEILRQAPQATGKRRAPQPGQQQGEQLKIIADERLNALIIVATLDTTRRIEELIDKLDEELTRDINRINVYYLNNALAEDLQKVLTGIISKQATVPGAPATAAGKASPLLTGKDVFITADKATNSLIIAASPEDYTLLKQIIERLDILRPQVYVEGLIVEISQTKFVELGVDWTFLKKLENQGDSIRAIGLSSLGPLAGIVAGTAGGKIPSLPEGGSVAITKGTVTLEDGTKVLNIPVLATMLARTSGVNVLAQPQILTSDNEDATITVGENRRFIRSTTVVSETANTVNTFEFRDVALNLKITPHINKDGFVRLTIQQTVENVLPGSSTEQGVETSKREAKTTVVVKNLETVIIGGLIRETNTPSVKKIPCLGDLPWLGWFFSRVSNTKEKTNLLIFLKPTVINTPEDLAKLSEEKKEKARKIREEDEKKKDIFYRTIIDGNYKFWKKWEDNVPMIDEESKLLSGEKEEQGIKNEVEINLDKNGSDEIKPENKEQELSPEVKDKEKDGKDGSNVKAKDSGKILLPSIKGIESVEEYEAISQPSAEDTLEPQSPPDGEGLPQPPTGEEIIPPSAGEELLQPLPPSGEPETSQLPPEPQE